jgi:hypothetical protein
MERKTSLLKKDEQLVVTRSVREGEVRPRTEFEPFSTTSSEP